MSLFLFSSRFGKGVGTSAETSMLAPAAACALPPHQLWLCLRFPQNSVTRRGIPVSPGQAARGGGEPPKLTSLKPAPAPTGDPPPPCSPPSVVGEECCSQLDGGKELLLFQFLQKWRLHHCSFSAFCCFGGSEITFL